MTPADAREYLQLAAQTATGRQAIRTALAQDGQPDSATARLPRCDRQAIRLAYAVSDSIADTFARYAR